MDKTGAAPEDQTQNRAPSLPSLEQSRKIWQKQRAAVCTQTGKKFKFKEMVI